MEQRRIIRVLEAIASQPDGSLPQRLCGGAALLLDAAGIGVALAVGDDLLETVHTTDAGDLGERLQTDLGEGPSYAAHRSGRPVLVEDLALDSTWPAFTPTASAHGLGAVFAFPLRSGSVRSGAFTVYRWDASELDDDQHADALVIARLALDLFLALQAGRPADELDQLFLDGTANTVEIHQAAGMVSVQLGIAVGAALALLRARAFSDGRSLRAIAKDIIARRLRLGHDG
ncbi:MAG: GAF domain-containing protein [Nitriliruptoraceae bacterium]